jgi:putative ABC transport system permease protein
MLEDEIEDAYSQSGMKDLLIIAAYVTVLAVTLACLGMLGMAMYAVQSRVKEVGIRKVMGASAADVMKLLSKSFMMLILIATFIGAPVSFILGQEFLAQFAFRIETGPLLILLSVAIIAVIGFITIGSQAMRAVLADPVRSLRYE